MRPGGPRARMNRLSEKTATRSGFKTARTPPLCSARRRARACPCRWSRPRGRHMSRARKTGAPPAAGPSMRPGGPRARMNRLSEKTATRSGFKTARTPLSCSARRRARACPCRWSRPRGRHMSRARKTGAPPAAGPSMRPGGPRARMNRLSGKTATRSGFKTARTPLSCSARRRARACPCR